jgi:serine phosphatase RsbU (regulator of sigma subunit)
MPGESSNASKSLPARTGHPPWWDTLALRLGVAVNLTVMIVLASSAWVDHRRDADTRIEHVLDRLQEEARVLRAAWRQFRDAGSFQQFIDDFCHQMTSSASPGHHIAVFDAHGHLVARAHERADPELEQLMRGHPVNQTRTFEYGRERFATVSLNLADGSRIAVAVSLRPVEEALRVQGMSRAATMGILVVVIFGLTALCLLVWVRDPLRGFVRAVSAASRRQFEERLVPRGAGELRLLAQGLNEMTDALGRSERERAAEMRRAREIQRALLGSPTAVVEGFETRSLFLPAASVGGDLVDLVTLQDGSALLAMIDVTGHGVPGALCTALLRSTIRHAARTTDDPRRIMRSMNRELCEIAAAGLFATAVLLKLNHERPCIEYVSAGHDPPVRVDPHGSTEALNHAGLLLGVDAGARYVIEEAELPPAARLFVFTDGLHEAMSPNGEQFGRARLADLLAGTALLPLEEQLRTVVEHVRSFREREGFEDDVTLFAVRRERADVDRGTDRRPEVRDDGDSAPCPAR